MGRKISVDSATMMNKGLEVIEACWLFDLPRGTDPGGIASAECDSFLVEYVDGSVLAQLGNPGYAHTHRACAGLAGAHRLRA